MITPLIMMILYLVGCIVVVLLTPRNDRQGLKIFSIGSSLILVLITCKIIHLFILANKNSTTAKASQYQFESFTPVLPEYGINLSFGVDGPSILLLLLTVYIMHICIFAARNTKKNYKLFIIFLLITELFLILAFATMNLFFFFIFFEGVVVPMWMLIGLWGSRERRIKAGMYLILYTIVGGFFLLYGTLSLYEITNSLEYTVLATADIPKEKQMFLFFCFAIPFAIKLPMLPFHLWLPEAHVEAPTIGSIILAALLLKLGLYGFFRFPLTLCPLACTHYRYLIFILAIVSIIFASLSAIRQSDLKRIIAYSSIAHMNLALLGLFSGTAEGIVGGIYLMYSHGIISAALFYCVGVLYDRHHTRLLRHFSGLALVMPLFCAFFFLFSCANMGFPGTANFVGEILIFAGFFIKNHFLVLFPAIGIVLSAVYSIWVFNRVSFGTLKTPSENIANYADLNRGDLYILLVLTIGMIALGLNSSLITSLIELPVNNILEASLPKN